MANELVLQKADGTQVVLEAKDLNKNNSNRVIRIQIKCRKIKKDGNSFNSVKGLKHIPVIEDGVNLGKKNRWLDVHFMRKAFTKDCDIASPEDLTTGFLYCKASLVQSPRTYMVKEDEETGELVYPTIWLKDGAVVGFEPYVSSQDEFEYHEDDAVEAEVVEAEPVEEEPEDEEEVKM